VTRPRSGRRRRRRCQRASELTVQCWEPPPTGKLTVLVLLHAYGEMGSTIAGRPILCAEPARPAAHRKMSRPALLCFAPLAVARRQSCRTFIEQLYVWHPRCDVKARQGAGATLAGSAGAWRLLLWFGMTQLVGSPSVNSVIALCVVRGCRMDGLSERESR
jgi:hypothetical protein